jgi:hypothetical protein
MTMSLGDSALRAGVLPAFAVVVLTLTACAGGGAAQPSAATPPPAQPAQPTTAAAAPATQPGAPTTGPSKATPAAQSSSPATVEIDPCALVTKAEAEAVLGAPSGEPETYFDSERASCRYETSSGLDVVSVGVTIYESEEDAEDSFQFALDVNRYPEVGGIGDRAYQSPINDITVLTGRYELSVDVTVKGGDADFPEARELAAKAVARLP